MAMQCLYQHTEERYMVLGCIYLLSNLFISEDLSLFFGGQLVLHIPLVGRYSRIGVLL